ncbi:MAG: LLM class flavin-dependent oxidoreductase [Sporocytophaga sp.]|nr:LLM class flavin-dependent oxidoreductase [Sporocytophaga sp.]
MYFTLGSWNPCEIRETKLVSTIVEYQWVKSIEMYISVLDQSHIPKGGTAEQALAATIELAKLADSLGYQRFWVSEHHNMYSVAGSSPEVLLGYLAAQTKKIRIGSGGVMLPHYSALKVAENFRILEALAPGRIDLGVGRAPGGDRLTASLLNPHNHFSEQDFIEQLQDLQGYLSDSLKSESDKGKVLATPVVKGVPEQWVLSSSGQSGLFAAHLGMAFAFAHFINPQGGARAVEVYRNYFKPSEQLRIPRVLVALFMFCSDSKERNEQVKAVLNYRFLQLETKGRFDPVTFEEIKDVKFSPAEEQRIAFNSLRFAIGTPEELRKQLTTLADDYDVNEIMAVNAAFDFEDRLKSYELFASVFK